VPLIKTNASAAAEPWTIDGFSIIWIMAAAK
jgi:hypothetical protein